jgi:hypothetical protein
MGLPRTSESHYQSILEFLFFCLPCTDPRELKALPHSQYSITVVPTLRQMLDAPLDSGFYKKEEGTVLAPGDIWQYLEIL